MPLPFGVLPFAVYQLVTCNMEARTYTKRTNARRAALQAGMPADRVVITVHKQGESLRFGFVDKDCARSAVPGAMPYQHLEVTADVASRAGGCLPQEVRNGVRRPGPGGVCRAVWDWLDANPILTAKAAKALAAAQGWNVNNVSSEYYAWKRFHRVLDR